MKKTLAVILGALTISSSVAFADVLPENIKVIDVCATITNAAAHPEFTLLSYTTYANGPYSYKQNPAPSLVKDGDCINSSGNIYQDTNVYALYTAYWKTKSSDAKYDPSKDTNTYTLNFGTESPMSTHIDKSSALTTAKYYYEIKDASTTQGIKYLNLNLTKKITNLETTTYTTYAAAFTDVQADTPYYKEIAYLKDQGYVHGYADGSYKPDNLINRAEFTKIVMSMGSGFRKTTNTPSLDCGKEVFKDVSTDAKNWYRDPVCKLHDLGIITGYGDNTFKPNNNISFGEAAKIILKSQGVWTDMDVKGTTPWYLAYTNFFVKYDAVPKRIKDYNEPITRGEMALMIYAETHVPQN